jgi:hypothetical protein
MRVEGIAGTYMRFAGTLRPLPPASLDTLGPLCPQGSKQYPQVPASTRSTRNLYSFIKQVDRKSKEESVSRQ